MFTDFEKHFMNLKNISPILKSSKNKSKMIKVEKVIKIENI